MAFPLTATKLLHGLEVVSLDVGAGGVGGANFLASVSGSGPLPAAVLVGLVSAILVVYNLDHLRDSYRMDPDASPRRRRYKDHRAWLVVWTVGAAVSGTVSMFFIPRGIGGAGVLLGRYLVVYFLGLRFGVRPALKRMMAALGWAMGLALPAWGTGGRIPELLMGVGILAAMGWINLQSYSVIDGLAESEGGGRPGPLRRIVAVSLAHGLILVAWFFNPELAWHWVALLAVA